MILERADPFGPSRVQLSPAALARWNEQGVLLPADVHTAARLCALAGVQDDLVLLAAALAVRAVRLGHVCVDLTTVAATTAPDPDLTDGWASLAWPEPEAWISALHAAPWLVAVGDDGETAARPLRLVGSLLYLDRYWRHEHRVAADLTARADDTGPASLHGGAAEGNATTLVGSQRRARLFRLFPPGGDDGQRLAAALVLTGRLAVIAGGPGTGKTTTVARALAALFEEAEDGRPLRIALAAPTGKAAARLGEAVRDEAETMAIPEPIRQQLRALEASTIHRLLGWRPDSNSRFRHDASNRLPHDVVVVDESSMLPLSLMAKLVDAVRSDARLVFVGDPQQLVSVEAGAVLGDVVGPAVTGPRWSPRCRRALEALAGSATGPDAATDPDAATGPDHPDPDLIVADRITVLTRVHRFGGDIAELASAIAAGDSDRAVGRLGAGGGGLRWLAPDDLAPVRDEVVAAGAVLLAAAQAADGPAALHALGRLRVLCAHRHGPAGVYAWNERIERWLAGVIPGYGAGGSWYLGRPLLVTANDYEVKLFNGDTGVVVAGEGGDGVAVFDRGGHVQQVATTQLASVETLHAMTVHKSQGSQFDEVVVVLPEADSPLLCRELLYTAVTRAQRRVTLVASEAAVRAAIDRRAARASGLRQRLWGGA